MWPVNSLSFTIFAHVAKTLNSTGLNHNEILVGLIFITKLMNLCCNFIILYKSVENCRFR